MKALIIAAAVAMIPVTALADEDISVILDGRQLSFEKAPFIEDGTTLVPMRAVFEGLGAKVEWNGEDRSITSTKEDKTIYMKIGSYEMKVNGDAVKLSKCPDIFEDFTFIPLRAVAEAFDAEVEWTGDTRTVTIETKITATPEPTPEPTAEPKEIPTPMPAEVSPKWVKGAPHMKCFTDTDGYFCYSFYGDTFTEIMAKGIQEYGVRIHEKNKALAPWEKAVVLPENVTVLPEEEFCDVQILVTFSESGVKLKPDTEYELQPYAVSDGMEHRVAKIEVQTLSTEDAEKFDVGAEVKEVFADNAVLRGIHDDSKQFVQLSILGIYLGEAEDKMEKYDNLIRKAEISSDTIMYFDHGWGTPVKVDGPLYKNKYYDFNLKEHLGVTLKPDTTYYYKFYIKWGGSERTSETLSFTTQTE